MPAVCDTCKGTGRVYTRQGPRGCPRGCQHGITRTRASNSSYMLVESALNYRMGAVGIEGFAIAVRRCASEYSVQEMADLCKVPVSLIQSVFEG